MMSREGYEWIETAFSRTAHKNCSRMITRFTWDLKVSAGRGELSEGWRRKMVLLTSSSGLAMEKDTTSFEWRYSTEMTFPIGMVARSLSVWLVFTF